MEVQLHTFTTSQNMDVSVQLYASVAFPLNTSGTLWIGGWVKGGSHIPSGSFGKEQDLSLAGNARISRPSGLSCVRVVCVGPCIIHTS